MAEEVQCTNTILQACLSEQTGVNEPTAMNIVDGFYVRAMLCVKTQRAKKLISAQRKYNVRKMGFRNQTSKTHQWTTKIHCAKIECFKHKMHMLYSRSVVQNKSRITFHRSQNHLPHHTVGVLWTWYQCARRTPLEQAYTLLLQRRSKPTPPPPRPSPAG